MFLSFDHLSLPDRLKRTGECYRGPPHTSG
jgi:hypothetical protein